VTQNDQCHEQRSLGIGKWANLLMGVLGVGAYLEPEEAVQAREMDDLRERLQGSISRCCSR
jgi:hypothetical protein